ncbi:glycosyltransferase [Ammoniphilus sp. YIM 78166]|uniref:glycosyltransferase n=1 Tax=Ammoniphilus sp. YIM 78166 TaxID=1644106 RepID=UPI00106F7DB3|nr:glycosyltransferase [Ammoniphilus sp. YIM 78166]
MNIKILTVGTRGDVQPFVALGRELRRRGHEVTICTGENFKAIVEGYGVSFSPVRVDYLKLTQSEEGQKMMNGNPLAVLKNMKTLVYPLMEQMLEDLWEAAQDAEVLIYHPKAFGGYDITEKLQIPVFAAHPIPVIAPTGLFTNPALPVSASIGWINQLSFRMNRLFMAAFFSIINRWRQDTLGLTTKRTLLSDDLKIKGKQIPVLYGCSPRVIPYDPTWKDQVSMSGFWFLEEEEGWKPSAEVLQFLEEGPPPLAISFSSMPLKDPNRVREMLVEALEKTNQRGVLMTGWSGMESSPLSPRIFTINALPHTWLFPRTCGVIHHGGAGTTAAVLKSGKPMIICPFSADQPFWAKRMKELGIATSPLKEKEMSVESFVHRIQELTSNPLLSRKAAMLANDLNRETALEDTAQFIEKKVERWRERG